ncbi:MAG: hypothetical protein HY720_21725 [Planctomycetes bacterium]|nr:hypothetical protein [Planctomycetota bacterium]
MTRSASILAALLFVLAPAALAGGVEWTHDYKAALERAFKEKKPVYVEFSAPW